MTNALLLTLRLETSVLVTGVGNGDENSARTLAYLPGSAFRGAAIARQLAQTPHPAPLTDDDLVRRFFSPAVRFLNAYPVVQGQRALPTPASLRHPKGGHALGEVLYDFALLAPEPTEQTERWSALFCVVPPAGQTLWGVKPPTNMQVHIGGQARGLVARGQSTVFKYEALSAGAEFWTAALFDHPLDGASLAALYPPGTRLNLGRSRSAEYGWVTVTQAQLVENWAENDLPEGGEEAITLTLLSDAVLKDAHGQPTLNLDQALALILERPVTALKVFTNTTVAGGFNRQWGLPLPLMPALGMGSVWVYAAHTFSPAELRALQDQGIGERRNEGFGRLSVNWLARPEWVIGEPPVPTAPEISAVPVTLAPSSQAQAQRMADRLWRIQLEAALRAALERGDQLSLRPAPKNHQLTRLRLLVRALLARSPEMIQENEKAGLQPEFEKFFNALRAPAQDALQRARVSGDQARLRWWLLERVKNLDFETYVVCPAPPLVAGQKAAWTPALKREFTLRLIEAMLYRAMKDNRQQETE